MSLKQDTKDRSLEVADKSYKVNTDNSAASLAPVVTCDSTPCFISLLDKNKKNDTLTNCDEIHESRLVSRATISHDEEKQATKVYKRRWYILGLYVLYMVCNSSQWLQYSIISSVTVKFYGVTNWHVNLTSLVMMGCYLPLALPAANLMDNVVSIENSFNFFFCYTCT